jgi:hypothetical protein
VKRRWWENSGDFVGARMELIAPNGVRATVLVASSFDGVDENGLKLGPPRRKERDLRGVPMRPEIDQRIVDAWLYGPRDPFLVAARQITERHMVQRERIALAVLTGQPVGAPVARTPEEAAELLGGPAARWRPWFEQSRPVFVEVSPRGHVLGVVKPGSEAP